MLITNLTPHEINIVREDSVFLARQLFRAIPENAKVLLVGDKSLTLAPSGVVARVSVTKTPQEPVFVGDTLIPVTTSVFGEVQNLPPVAPGQYFIVSALVAQAARGRQDLLIPDDTVRDEQGRIIGCRAFARV